MKVRGALKKILTVILFIIFIMVVAVIYLLFTNKLFRKQEDMTETFAEETAHVSGLLYTAVEAADDFSVLDVEGNTVKLSELKGRPVVINFWATWCRYCVQEMQEFEKICQESGDDIEIMMIDLTDGISETMESADNYIDENGFTFPVYYDTGGYAAKAYGIHSIPQTFFINAEGSLMAKINGATDHATIKEGIDLITAFGS